MKDWHESQESWARLVAELRAENASLHIHQCRDLESGRERDALVERLQRTIGESMGEVDRLRAELAECQRAWHAQVNAELRPAEAEIRRLHGIVQSCVDHGGGHAKENERLRAGMEIILRELDDRD